MGIFRKKKRPVGSVTTYADLTRAQRDHLCSVLADENITMDKARQLAAELGMVQNDMFVASLRHTQDLVDERKQAQAQAEADQRARVQARATMSPSEDQDRQTFTQLFR